MIRVLLADDENLICDALAGLLGLEEDFVVVAQAASGPEALALAVKEWPDVALLDLQMPGLDGIEVAAQLKTDLPDCRCVIITSHGRAGYLKHALAVGVVGFLPKTVCRAGPGDPHGGRWGTLRGSSAGRRGHRGRGLPVDAARVRRPGPRRRGQSRRGDRGAGAPLPRTVRNYLSSAVTKLGVANRHEAVREARARSWI